MRFEVAGLTPRVVVPQSLSQNVFELVRLLTENLARKPNPRLGSGEGGGKKEKGLAGPRRRD